MTVEDGRRVARFDGQVIRGVAVIDDRNGPFRLVFRIDGIPGVVVLDTSRWAVEWENNHD